MPNEPEAPRLSQAIGARVKELRLAKGWTQEQLARRLNSVGGGSTWTRSMVSALESGGKAIDPETLVLLTLTFICSMGDLFEVKTTVKLDEDRFATPKGLRELFRGPNVNDLYPPGQFFPWSKATTEGLMDAMKKFQEHVTKAVEGFNLDGVSMLALERAERGDLGRLIARRLSTSSTNVASAAFHLWGHSAEDEREKRAVDRPNAKQWISRDLRAEIEELLVSLGKLKRKESAE